MHAASRPTTILILLLPALIPIRSAQPPPASGQFSMDPVNHTSLLAQLVSTQADITPFIIGGTEAAVGEYPWMAYVVGYETSGVIVVKCGGVLIRPDWVLSALHCVLDQNSNLFAPNYAAYMGGTDIGNFDAERFEFEGETYQPELGDFETFFTVDIANLDLVLLKLSTPTVLPHLDIPAEDSSGTLGVVTGWGADENGETTLVLQVLDDVPLLPDSSCIALAYAYDLNYYRCAGYLQGITGPCHGDSGGPLIVPNAAAKHGFDLIGTVVATAGACTDPGNPELYTDLVVLKDSVEAIVGPPTTQPKSVDPTPSPVAGPGEPSPMCACSCSCTNGFEYEYEHKYSGDACT